MRFGVWPEASPRNEALTVEQRDLFQETLASDLAAAEAELAKQQASVVPSESQVPRAPRPRAGRQPLPDHLPRMALGQPLEHRHEAESCTCGQCGNDLTKIGEDISEQLDGVA